jgi:two-component system OmpR family sensor kinase
VFPPKRITMSTRVAVAVAAVLAAGVLVLSFAAYWRVSGQLNADLDRSLLRESEAFQAALSPTVAGGSDLRTATRAYLNARSQSFSGTYPVLLVRFASGSPLVISNADLLLENAPGNVAALDVRTARSQFIDLTLAGVVYRAATVPIHSTTGTVVAVFEAALPASPSRDLGTQVLISLLGVATLVTILGALLAVLAARASLRPLRKAATTASRVTQSSLTERIDYAGPDDEVGHMVSSINAMLDRLERAFGEQRKFTADASHELRTPLAVISGHLEMLRDVEMSEAERTEELALISDEVARMGRLVDDLLALARLEAGAPTPHQPLEVSSLLDEAAARGRGLGDRVIRVSAEADLWVDGDPDQLMQAFLNLVGNAVAYTRDGGTIALSAAGDASSITVRIADDGPGIRTEDLDRVFDRFYRAQGPRPGKSGGSGLGLAITQRLIELHSGTITAGNRPEGGAVFTVRLPRIQPPVAWTALDARSRKRS